jgi:hypothetical protein
MISVTMALLVMMGTRGQPQNNTAAGAHQPTIRIRVIDVATMKPVAKKKVRVQMRNGEPISPHTTTAEDMLRDLQAGPDGFQYCSRMRRC